MYGICGYISLLGLSALDGEDRPAAAATNTESIMVADVSARREKEEKDGRETGEENLPPPPPPELIGCNNPGRHQGKRH